MLLAVRRQAWPLLAIGVLGLLIVGEAQWDCADVFRREYHGTASQACPKNSFGLSSCFDCLPWANATGWRYGPQNDSDTDLIENYCRFVSDKAGPVCYIRTPDGRIGVEYCQVPPCHAHSGCMTGNGSDYRDQAMYTENGYSCLRWDQVQDHDVNSTSYPDAGLEENYCRNPDNSTKPWCYYRDQDMQIRRDFCPIETCKSDALSKFQRHRKIYIPANNRKYQRGWWRDLTAEDCARFCLEERTFVCRSFEYREEYYFDDRRCILTDQSLHTLDTYRSTSSGHSIDLFTRIDKICDAYQANAIPDECPLPLGVQDGARANASVTASSSAGPDHGPNQARLGGASYWKPDPNATVAGHWLQVCFVSRMLVSGVLTQGGGTGEEAGWVEDFELEYRQDGGNWWKYRDYREFDREPEIMVFRANGETSCPRPVILPTPIRAHCVRIVPTLWNHALHLRIDLIGCLANDCDVVLGLSDGRVLDAQITSSSSSREDNSAKTVRLNPLDRQPGTGWVPATSDPQQWLLVDLRRSHDVRAVLTQGCGNRELWVTSFRMSYSASGDESSVRFQPYVDQDGAIKDFLANSDQHTIARHDLVPEVTARYVRIEPVTWRLAGIGLRLELVGCVHRACGQRLGMESGTITASQLAASSNFNSRAPRHGRLHYEIVVPPSGGRYCCWGPRHELGVAEWLQADLGTLHTVTGVITQGAGNPWRYYWVEQYKIQWLSPNEEGGRYRTYRDLQGDEMIFQGNTDQNSEKRNDLDRPFITSRVRIVPHTWHNITACMRVEFIGCLLEGIGRICSNLLLDGYCVGSVNSQRPTACQEIFSEGSRPLVINSDRLQGRLWEKHNDLLIENQHRYLIGLTRPRGEDSYRWVDGTPITYSNIRWPLDHYNRSMDYCVCIDSEELFNWREYECANDHSRKAQICQIDIDECLSVDHGCSHECVNVPGSYYCECPQGYRLNETDLKTCSDICESQVHDLFPLHFEGDGNSCYGSPSRDATWTEAIATCGEASSHLPRMDDAVFLWLATAHNESLSWALADGNGSSSVSDKCPAVRTDDVSSVVEDIPCSDELPFLCQREYEDVKCNALWESDAVVVETSLLEGYIQSLSYAPWYDAGSTCTVHIKGPEVYRTRFIISRMTLRKLTPADGQISSCLDSLEITDDIPGHGLTPRGRYCGSLRDLEVVTRSSNVRVVFTVGPLSANMPRELGFVASYQPINCTAEDCTADCGTNPVLLTEPSGSLVTRGFPVPLPPFSTCRWRIRLPEGRYVRLEFSDFRVARDSGTGDCLDAVLVTEDDVIGHGAEAGWGRRASSGTLCGTAPPQIISESQELYIFYATGLDVLSEGFRATYTSVDLPGCGVGLRSAAKDLDCQAPEATLTSVRHPLPYPAHSRYTWRITTPPTTYVRLAFGAFDIPSATPCEGDVVTILDGEAKRDDPLGEFCNSRQPPGEVLSSMNEMIVEFETKDENGGTGFTAVYRALRFLPKVSLTSPYDEGHSCGSGWVEYYGNCYHFHRANATLMWRDAERQCAMEGALLTSVNDYGEMNFVHFMLTSEWFTNETATYIGLTDVQEEGHFRWLDGRPLSYSDWNVESDGYTQPDGGLLEDCSVIVMRSLHSTQNWEDIPCSLRAARQFICKKPASQADGSQHNASQTLGELQTKECDSGWSLAGSLCARLLPATDAVAPDNDDSDDCLPGVQVQATPDLLASVLYLVRHVWTDPSIRREGFRIGVMGQSWYTPSDPETEYGECVAVAYSDSRWQLERGISCNSPVSATVCYHQTTEVTQQCGESMFSCGSAECVQLVYVCDGTVDCADASDETMCTHVQDRTDAVSSSESCNSELFRCARGGCLSLSFLCDFIRQCPDGSDEEHCVYPPCQPSEFTCRSGQCVDGARRCDIRLDCRDGSDEIDCATCRMAFQCYDSSCIPHHAVCDATQDCPGFIREDEANCAYSSDPDFRCGANQLRCNNGACADMIHWCVYDFDEFGYQTGCRDVTHLRFCEHFTCSAYSYKCPRSYCIPLSRRCDNVLDCPNGEDELLCEPSVCPSGSYKCRGSQVCLREDQVCNGATECPGRDDELFCGVHCPDGCQCIGLSFTCVGVVWNQTKAEDLPDTLRRLILSNTIVTGTVQRQRQELRSHNATLEDLLLLRLERFHFLYDLDISGNLIEILEPGMFHQQKNLYLLSVANNRLYHLEPETFEGLRWLQKLDLAGNPLVHIQPGAFHHLQSLPELDLHSLAISHMYSGTFDGLESLQRLDLSSNNLLELEPGTFDGLSLVTRLDISGNSLRVFPQDMFSGMTSLQVLHSDKYLFCCMVGEIQECTPEPDQFSSCADLMRNLVLRAFIWILGLSAFLGNLFVVVWRLRTKQRFKVQSLLILNLALSDCLMGVYMLILAAADVHYRDVYIYFADAWKSSALCTVAGFLSAFSSEASVFTLTVITLDRFLCIMFPFGRLRLGRTSVRWVVAATWLLAFLLALIPALGLPYFGERYYGRSSVCLALPLTSERSPGWEYSTVLFLGVNLVGILTILVCYTAIYVYAKRSAKQIRSTKGAANELKLATKTFLIIATDMCCWFPIVIMGYLSLSGSVVIPPTVYAWTAVFVLPINSSINPYLYTISSIGLPKLLEVSNNYKSHRCHCQDGPLTSEIALGNIRINGHPHTVTTPTQTPLTRRKAPSSGRFLLSALLSEMPSPAVRLSSDDLRSVETDLRAALRVLHGSGLGLGGVAKEAVVLHKESTDSEWHASLLLPRVAPGEGAVPVDHDALAEDERRLGDTMQCMRSQLASSSGVY